MEHKDVTVEAWRVLKVLEAVSQSNGRVTLSKLGDLARGKGSGTLEVPGNLRVKGKQRETLDIDVESLTEGRVELNKEVGEFPPFGSLVMLICSVGI